MLTPGSVHSIVLPSLGEYYTESPFTGDPLNLIRVMPAEGSGGPNDSPWFFLSQNRFPFCWKAVFLCLVINCKECGLWVYVI